MFKLNRHIESLEHIQKRIDEKISILQDKMEIIENKALNQGRELTYSERERYYNITDEIEELEGESNAIQNALDLLSEYEIY